MRFKIDENLPPLAARMLRDNGHDAITVQDQKLGGKPDRQIAPVLRAEQRAFITLDLDFADITAYPPSEYPGIIVLRLVKQDKARALAAIRRLLPVLDREQLQGRLWVFDENKLRVRGGE